jgi:predicted DNA-binding transcriptional regulator AlpA
LAEAEAQVFIQNFYPRRFFYEGYRMCRGRENISRRMLGIEEVSTIIGLKPQTIRNKLSNGTFPIATRKIGRLLKWDSKDIERFLDSLPKIN